MKAWGLYEPVWVLKMGQGEWPQEFTWRGRRRKVRRIEAYEAAGAGNRSTGLRRFRLKTEGGLACVLSHDQGRDRWSLERLYASQGGA